MKFGLFGGARLGPNNPLGDSYNYKDFVTYVKDAEELGFESIFLVEHHFTGAGQLSASLNLLSYLAACTTRIRLGTAVVVLPWHNPVLLAEQVATLDVLSGGRVDLGVGRGYRKIEFEQFCIPMEEAQERYAECLEVMLKAWTTPGRFSHHGKRWHFKDIVVEPAPQQQPHPPIWMAAGTPGGIAYVAGQNYGLLLDQLATMDQVEERVRLYLEGLAAKGFPRDASRVGVTRALSLVTTEEERKKAHEAAAGDVQENRRHRAPDPGRRARELRRDGRGRRRGLDRHAGRDRRKAAGARRARGGVRAAHERRGQSEDARALHEGNRAARRARARARHAGQDRRGGLKGRRVGVGVFAATRA